MEGRRSKSASQETTYRNFFRLVAIALAFISCIHFGRGIRLVGYDIIIAMDGREMRLE
ncbi:829_t:CDS:2 [Entrophospora sp. SA101]|nr:829_t:CDS:2 [Entrophospora sp. SA101]CAJ0882228.1 8874_t:CDS:2 [Entrophospora sp. SA101]CAJ0882240.1 8875_t:CDS:2 [Entrophospora sp. SA101]